MKFSFVVLSYNHQNYIIEHLESIKFQIQEFGTGIEFQLIIADDGSRDRTIELVRMWIQSNSNLFTSCEVIADGVNRGTCYNYTKTWARIEGEYFKITAGDDVYSCENLFENLSLLDEFEIVSGIPLLLMDGVICFSFEQAFNIVATARIYRNRHYLEKLKRISVSNAPNIFFPMKVVRTKVIEDFVNRFFVTEDFPLHIKMAEVFNPLRFKQLTKPYVYYRRTENSTYLVQANKVNVDKAAIYQYLIDSEKNSFERGLLKNRLVCYKMKNRKLARVLNLGYYLYALRVLAHLGSILRQYAAIDKDVTRHQEHMNLIKKRAEAFPSM
jgi:glycosyltransferase involved in cell wall biosynthesis